MSATETTPHDDVLDDLPALLTGELSPAREREVADHLDDCDACRRELAVVARASAWLQDAARLGDFDPSPDEEQVPLPPLQLPKHDWSGLRGRRSGNGRSGPARPGRNRLLAVAASVILLAVGVVGGVVVGRTTGGSDTGRRAAVALHPVPGGVPVGDAVGEAKLSADGGMHLAVNGLPAPPGQDFYEIWLYDPPTGRMLAVGVLPPNGKGTYSLPPQVEQGYSAVEISLEPNDGNPEHSKLSVLRGPMA